MSASLPNNRPLAAIDIGTNSIRLLVAVPDEHGARLRPLVDRTVMVRLGHGVERTGRLDPARLARAAEVVDEFRRLALARDATTILVAATSAVRDAADGALLRERIAATSGLPVTIVDGEREAALTFAGATLGQPTTGITLVADLGGGSLELIVARDATLLWTRSLQLGSGRLTERYVSSDPPTRDALTAVEHAARAALEPLAREALPFDRCLIVGGTAQSLPLLPAWPDGDPTITRDRLADALADLAATSAAELVAATGLDLERVRTLAAGVTILDALLTAFGLASATIVQGGIREGLLLEYVNAES